MTHEESYYTSSLALLAQRDPAPLSHRSVLDILHLRSSDGLPAPAVALLLKLLEQTHNSDFRRIVIQTARSLRQNIFGRKVAIMAPVELSSVCQSNCKFCGWRSDNRDMERLRLTEKGVIKQVEWLIDSGITHIELVAGDDLPYLKGNLPKFLQITKQVAAQKKRDVRVSVCTTALTTAQYSTLRDAGADAVLTWQETYFKEIYNAVITTGPKAKGINGSWVTSRNGDGFTFRLESQQRALSAGLQVGIGAMLGLNQNTAAEVFSVILHARRLIRDGANTPIIIGMPLWNHITTAKTDQLKEGPLTFDPARDFEFVAALYLLALPDKNAWVFPNCRVPIHIQADTVQTAGAFTSSVVRVGPGGYLLDMKISDTGSYVVKLAGANSPDLSLAEQFVHFHDSHERYISEFIARGLTPVTDTKLLSNE